MEKIQREANKKLECKRKMWAPQSILPANRRKCIIYRGPYKVIQGIYLLHVNLLNATFSFSFFLLDKKPLHEIKPQSKLFFLL